MEEKLQWLTNPEVFQVNRIDAHSDHITFLSEDEIILNESSLRQSLNGKWQFLFSETINEIPEGFYEDDYPLEDFDLINVPGHIELQGYGQIQYINTLYPWDGQSQILPPEIDFERTTVGNYVRYFDLEENLKNKDIYISFQGVEKAFFVWLNGHFIGYSEDSFTPSEFKLTPYIKDKNNKLSVQVFQNSSASWLEDQDMFRFSGIFRDVFLYAKPEVYIDDVWFQTKIKENEGILKLRLKVQSKSKDYSIDFQIKNPEGQEIFNKKLDLTSKGDFIYSEEIKIPDVKIWSHEKPNLYSTLLTIRNKDNQIVGLIPYKIGFRDFKLDNGLISLNNEPLFIKGVNRHEWHPNKGRAISKEDMDADMDLIKQNNINAVRTSHYPNQSYWYELCDENGIYMIDETNLETHGSWQKLMVEDPSWNVPGDLPEWKENVLDRARSMFERDKNHPSILFWSVGNESYAGSNLMAMADYFREQDNSRLVHYEGSFHNRKWNDISDVESQMYSSPEYIIEFLDNNPDKPFILCEFMHNMGNSLGGFDSYMKLNQKNPHFQGGFIWDFKDQALWKKDHLGNAYLAYGGDFGDRQSDYNFSGNGIISADMQEKPATQEVKYWYQSEEERNKQDQINKEQKEFYLKQVDKKLKVLKDQEIETSSIKIIKGDGGYSVKGKNFSVIFSITEGGPVSIKKNNKEWLWRAPRPAFWRAPTENDIGNQFALNSSIWQAVENAQKVKDIRTEEKEKEFIIEYTYISPILPGLETKVSYHVNCNGLIKVLSDTQIPDEAPEIALFGLRFQTFESVKDYEWIGIENETYPDRKNGVFGEFKEEPGISNYLVPQETGNHFNSYYVSLKDPQDDKLELFYDSKPFNFSVLPYTPGQLQEAYHSHELPNSVRSVLTVSGFMRGVGGIDSWGSDVEEKYRLNEKNYSFSFYIV